MKAISVSRTREKTDGWLQRTWFRSSFYISRTLVFQLLDPFMVTNKKQYVTMLIGLCCAKQTLLGWAWRDRTYVRLTQPSGQRHCHIRWQICWVMTPKCNLIISKGVDANHPSESPAMPPSSPQNTHTQLEKADLWRGGVRAYIQMNTVWNLSPAPQQGQK